MLRNNGRSPVSVSRSSNRTCRITASGFPTEFGTQTPPNRPQRYRRIEPTQMRSEKARCSGLPSTTGADTSGSRHAYTLSGGRRPAPAPVGAPPPTRLRVAGKWTYLYRAIDPAGNTIDFLLSPKRDRIAAKVFLQLSLWRVGQIQPRVINVDGHSAYSGVDDELKRAG